MWDYSWEKNRYLESIIPKVQIKDYIYKTGPEGEINSFITVDGEKYIFESFLLRK